MEYLSISNINKSFGKFKALDDISFKINKGEFICLLGPSGCGKTTLLRIISGLETPNSGAISLLGKDITKLEPAKRNFGIVFQSYVLFPNMNAEENVAYGLKNRKLSKTQIDEKVKEVLSLVGLYEARKKYPNELSGGQQQRIALARALALSPQVLLLDEPLSALDAKVREHLRREIKMLQQKLGITTIMVTHDQEEALTMADRIVVMKNSEIVQIGTPYEIYNKPNNKFVAGFVGNVNFIEKNGQTFAIRPEKIAYSMEMNEGYQRAVVRDIEFRGSFYRLILESNEQRLSSKDREIVMDLIAKEKESFQIKEGTNLYVKFNDDILLSN